MFRRTAIITAAVALTAGLALTGCSAGGTAAAGGGTASAPASAAAPKGAGLNTPVKVGSFEFTVTASKDAGTTVGPSPLTKTAQGTFIEVDLTIKNVGNSSVTFLSNYVKLVDGTGKTYDADPTATLYASPNQSAWVAAINPGNTLTGPVLFDVPAGTRAAQVQVSDNAFSKGETIALQ
jgi:archaellum component FlaG (FlaF/FlaG flagellin family)